MARIANIYNASLVDGEGWRYTIFFQGCNHNCKGCHNPQSHDFNGGIEVTIDELKEQLDNAIKTNPLIDGITLSGGDPLFQAKDAYEIAKYAREKELTVWVYTGFTFEQLLDIIKGNYNSYMLQKEDINNLLFNIDVLVDGPFILEKRSLHLQYKGSSNQRILDIPKSMKEKKPIEYILE